MESARRRHLRAAETVINQDDSSHTQARSWLHQTPLCGLLTILLSSCGGGGSDAPAPQAPPPPPPPVASAPTAPVDHLSFNRLSTNAGLSYVHGFSAFSPSTEAVAGVAVGDYDGDGWLDLYIAQGDTGLNLLYRNTSQNGEYSFEDVASAAGVAMLPDDKSSGPAFVDYDGDGDDDLFVGSIEYDDFKVFNNNGDGTFQDVTAATGLSTLIRENNVSVVFGDYDQDSDLDLFIAHWTFTENELPPGSPQFLWRNNGDGSFTDVTDETLIADAAISFDEDYSFTPNFADIDNDRDLDLLLVSDNDTSQVIINNGDQGGGLYTFSRITDEAVITDQAGMGAAVADFDNDGDLDWFVSSIEEQGNRDRSGNRFYRNEGNGIFVDSTNDTGVRSGYWGWASCAADFNNDGHLDLFHVNGIGTEAGTSEFVFDPSRLFIADGDGSFTEYSEELGIEDPRQGRGIVCFDGDRDGDVDIFIANNGDFPSLYRNDGGNSFNWINLKLLGNAPNTAAIGARIFVASDGFTQMREVSSGNNYVSQNPTEQHFGLDQLGAAPSVRVLWPDGTQTERFNVAANQRLQVTYPDSWSID